MGRWNRRTAVERIPRRRKDRNKGGEAGEKAACLQGNEEALSVTSFPSPRGFPFPGLVPGFLFPGARSLGSWTWGLASWGRGVSGSPRRGREARPLSPSFRAVLIKSFPKTGKGIRLTSGKADASTCPSPHVWRREGGREAGGSQGFSVPLMIIRCN